MTFFLFMRHRRVGRFLFRGQQGCRSLGQSRFLQKIQAEKILRSGDFFQNRLPAWPWMSVKNPETPLPEEQKWP